MRSTLLARTILGLSFSMLAVAGCGGGTTPPPADSGVDTGTPAVDVGPRDGGPDTGVAVDGGQDASAPGDTGTLADSGGGDTGTRDAGRGVPMNHRVDDSECAGAAPPGDCSFAGGGCDTDADCTAGVNGRCNMNNGGAVFCRCTYDTCMGDTNCDTGTTCACHGATFHPDSNECVSGDCRVDMDCGVGGFCSPTIGGCGSLAGYFCHTATDTCLNDTDCAAGRPQACEFVSASMRWECVDRAFCP